MANFRTTKEFLGSGTVTDGYDEYSPRVDGVDILFASDINNLSDSVVEVQKSLLDGYAVTTILARSPAVSFQDGQTLVYNASQTKLVPGASGDASFKLQSVTTPNAVIKSGFLILDNGKELRLASDTTINLTTVLGSAPADATSYHLYVDLNTLPAVTTVSGRKLYDMVQANFALSTSSPETISQSRYVPIGQILSATTGTAWSGTGSSFVTLAVRRHSRPAVNVSPVVFTLTGITSASHPNGTIITHNANLLPKDQLWMATVDATDGYSYQLDSTWVIDQNANTIEVDFSFLPAGTASIKLQNTALSVNSIPTKTYDSGIIAANALTLPLSHNLGMMPTAIVLQHETTPASGSYENLNPSDYIEVTATQITGTLAALGTDKIRIVASSATEAVTDNASALITGFTSSAVLSQVNLSHRTATATTGTPAAGVFHSTIVGRARMVDLSNDLLPRMGTERIQIQQIMQVSGEMGPANQIVSKPVNDKFDQIRFVGDWRATTTTNGSKILSSATFNITDYAEVTFYGTGLNLLTLYDGTVQNTVYSINGATEVGNIHPASNSSVISARNYSPNQVVLVVSGLALGTYTIKLRNNSASVDTHIAGFEILNESSSVKIATGSALVNGALLSSSALVSSAHNSEFESGTLGTRGGRVVVYMKTDGTIGKAVQPTDASSLTLTSTNHANEEVIRNYFWREFGAGRVDDFSTLGSSPSVRAFTLDDGTTTLAMSSGQSAIIGKYDSLVAPSINNSITLTFVGTGLDLQAVDNNTGTETGMCNILIDGTSAGQLTTTGAGSGGSKVYKIASGLPYGTHTVKFLTPVTNTVFSRYFTNFIVYGPKKPTLPSGAIELADYNVMANYVTSSAGALTKSSGTLAKAATREITYLGASWVVASDSTTSTGLSVESNVLNDYAGYTFTGTGVELRTTLIQNYEYNLTLLVDGSALNAGTNVGSSSQLVAGTSTGITLSAAGLLSGTNSGSTQIGAIISIAGLSFGTHTIRVTNSKVGSSGFTATASLSLARGALAATSVGTKALFAGGHNGTTNEINARVDIYDSATNSWSTASLSQARFGLAATTVGTKAIFAGGHQGFNQLASAQVDIYDSSTNSWSTAVLSQARAFLAATTVGTKAIFAGGSTAGYYGTYGVTNTTTRVDIYDSATNSWSTASLSQARGALAATTVGTKAIFAGGCSFVDSFYYIDSFPSIVSYDFLQGALSQVDIYDSATNSWSTASLSLARGALAATSVGTKALFAGGHNGTTNEINARVDIYDSATNSWSTASLSQARGAIAATTVGTKAIFAGGAVSYETASTQVDIYDSATNSWSTTSLPQASRDFAATTVGTKAIFAGGFPFSNSAATARVDIYTIVTSQGINSLDVITPIHSHKNNGPFIAQNTLSIGSQGINDCRKFGNQLQISRNVSEAVKLANSTSTSVTYVPVTDLSTTIKTNGNPIRVSVTGAAIASGAYFTLMVDGVLMKQSIGYSYITGSAQPYGISAVVPLTAGFHKIDVMVRTTTGTTTVYNDNLVSSVLTVEEISNA